MIFRPPRRQGLLIGFALLGALLALDGVWLGLLTSLANPTLAPLWLALIIISLPALAFVVYSLIGLARLAYTINGEALTIHWGFQPIVLPLAEIEDVLRADEVESDAAGLLHLRGLYWPGRLIGPGRAETFGPAHFYATRRWPEQVLVLRRQSVHVLSPSDAAGFQAAYVRARELHPPLPSAPPERPPLITRLREALRDSSHDRVAQALIIAGVVLNLLLFGYLAWLAPRLPSSVPLHFNQDGVPDVLGPPSQAFILPVIGLFVLMLNSVLGWVLHMRRDRSPAYLLWSATILVQVMLWVAVFGLSANT
jgi:hypothetical protein